MALNLCTSDSARNCVRVEFQTEPNREAGESPRTFRIAALECRWAVQQLLFRKEEKFRLILI